MAVSTLSKGKKRAHVQDREGSLNDSPSPAAAGSNTPKTKKPKRAETRVCPVCDEVLPIRLLATHAELESQRLENIFDQVGSTEAIYEEPDYGPGPSLRSARSSQKARRSRDADTTHEAEKTIQAIKRHRKRRHIQFRELGREDDRGRENTSREEIVCPVCLVTVRGDQDVLDAHVDACLANESRRLEEERLRVLEQEAAEDEVWEESFNADGAAGHVGSVRGTGFHTRDRNEQDIEDDVDIDGDDGFGDVQFTEGDVLPISSSRAEENEEEDVEIDGNGENDLDVQRTQQTLRELIAEGKAVRNSSGSKLDETKAKLEEVLGISDTDKMDLAILAAKKRGDKASMITALENKVKQLVRSTACRSIVCLKECAGVYARRAADIAALSNMH
ncbi:hypothetical protein C0993_012350 [Termitomyces sp. T159_Od127]|nr:hypothetical protein C0993_012350 [Termitomyces sp. T159_Od127]